MKICVAANKTRRTTCKQHSGTPTRRESTMTEKEKQDDTVHTKASEYHIRDTRLIHIFFEPDEMKISQDPATQFTFPIG
jgi:hypothetical protein